MENYKTLFHGSNIKFNSFEYKFHGVSNGLDAGYGFYFSTNKIDALCYGKNIYECNVRLMNGFSNIKKTITPEFVYSLINKLRIETESNYFENYPGEKPNSVIKDLFDNCDCDTEIIGDIVNASFGGYSEKVLKILTKMNYNHAIDRKSPESKDIIHYIIYDNNDIVINSVQNINEL